MGDEFKYKALLNELKQKGMKNLQYQIISKPEIDSSIDINIKFEFNNFVFYECVAYSQASYSGKCEILSIVKHFIDSFINKNYVDNYFYFIHFQLISKAYFISQDRLHFLGGCVDVLSNAMIKKYPDPIDFIENIENIDVSYLIDNSRIY